MSVLSKYMRELRENANLTQQKVADYLKIGRSTYSNYENGYREPDFSIVENLAAFYNVSIEGFFCDPLIYKINESNTGPGYNAKANVQLTDMEEELLRDFRHLSEADQKEILYLMEYKVKHMQKTD